MALVCAVNQPDKSVVGWSRQITGQRVDDFYTHDKFKSICIMPGRGTTPGGDPWVEDQIWAVVERTINGQTSTFIELFTPVDWGNDDRYAWFVDCGPGDRQTLYQPGQAEIPGISDYPYLCACVYEDPSPTATPADTPLVSPISVTSAAGLQAMTGTNHYSIDADINLDGVAWTPIASFSGVVEGNNRTISNLTIAACLNQAGLFASITGGQVRNLNLSNFSFAAQSSSATTRIGALAGLVSGGAEIINIHVNNITITGSMGYNVSFLGRGGMIGTGNPKCYDCSVDNCEILAESGLMHLVGDIGGFIGGSTSGAIFIRCSTTNVTIENCTREAGGFVGHGYGTFKECTADADISGNVALNWVGGFVGLGEQLGYSYCSAEGSISGTTSEVASLLGGFCGQNNNASFTFCTTSTSIEITGSNYIMDIGGFCGSIFGYQTVSCCYSTGSVTLINSSYVQSIGGFFGTAYTATDVSLKTFRYSFSSSDIDIADSTINDGLYTNMGIGGFAGNISGHGPCKFQDCYASGNIISGTEGYYTGGFLGYTYMFTGHANILTNCYYAGLITDGDYVGGLIGAEDRVVSVVTASYWDQELSGIEASAGGVGQTTSWMQTEANYVNAGWDFTTIWCMDSGEPAIPEQWFTHDANQLDGAIVCVYADGVPRGSFTMDGNDIADFNESDYEVVIAGLNYWSRFETLPLQLPWSPELGLSRGEQRLADKQLSAIRFDLKDTYYLEYAMGANSTPILCNFNAIIDSSIKYERVTSPFGSTKKPTIYIQTYEPVPLGIRAIVPEVTYYRRR